MNHAQLVADLTKPGEAIKSELTPLDCHILHMAIGVSGEAGELLDAIKRAVIYRKPIALDNVIEELGDLEFYMEGLRAALAITRARCLEENILKLQQRYSKMQYTDRDAQERADKA
jgi:NTP pyrophosphatase (non-canonical NTP hydrolase)